MSEMTSRATPVAGPSYWKRFPSTSQRLANEVIAHTPETLPPTPRSTGRDISPTIHSEGGDHGEHHDCIPDSDGGLQDMVEFTQELARMQQSRFLDQRRSHEEEKRDLRESLESRITAALRDQTEGHEAERQRWRKEVDRLEGTQRHYERAYRQEAGARVQTESRLRDLMREAETLKLQNKELEASAQRDVLALSADSEKKAREKVEKAEKTLAEAEMALKSVKERNEHLTGSINEERARREDAETKLAEAESAHKAMKEKLENTEKRANDERSKREDVETKLAEAESTLSDLKARGQQDEELENLQTRVRALESVNLQLERQNTELEQRITISAQLDEKPAPTRVSPAPVAWASPKSAIARPSVISPGSGPQRTAVPAPASASASASASAPVPGSGASQSPRAAFLTHAISRLSSEAASSPRSLAPVALPNADADATADAGPDAEVVTNPSDQPALVGSSSSQSQDSPSTLPAPQETVTPPLSTVADQPTSELHPEVDQSTRTSASTGAASARPQTPVESPTSQSQSPLIEGERTNAQSVVGESSGSRLDRLEVEAAAKRITDTITPFDRGGPTPGPIPGVESAAPAMPSTLNSTLTLPSTSSSTSTSTSTSKTSLPSPSLASAKAASAPGPGPSPKAPTRSTPSAPPRPNVPRAQRRHRPSTLPESVLSDRRSTSTPPPGKFRPKSRQLASTPAGAMRSDKKTPQRGSKRDNPSKAAASQKRRRSSTLASKHHDSSSTALSPSSDSGITSLSSEINIKFEADDDIDPDATSPDLTAPVSSNDEGEQQRVKRRYKKRKAKILETGDDADAEAEGGANDEFEIESILAEIDRPIKAAPYGGARKEGSVATTRKEYKVKWKGFPDSEASWIWADTVDADGHWDELLAEFYARQEGSLKRARFSRAGRS